MEGSITRGSKSLLVHCYNLLLSFLMFSCEMKENLAYHGKADVGLFSYKYMFMLFSLIWQWGFLIRTYYKGLWWVNQLWKQFDQVYKVKMKVLLIKELSRSGQNTYHFFLVLVLSLTLISILSQKATFNANNWWE